MMPEKYEVAFVVYADIPENDSSIGDLECNGTLKSYNCYCLRDARMYFTISAETPEEAYKKGIEKCVPWCYNNNKRQASTHNSHAAGLQALSTV